MEGPVTIESHDKNLWTHSFREIWESTKICRNTKNLQILRIGKKVKNPPKNKWDGFFPYILESRFFSMIRLYDFLSFLKSIWHNSEN